MQEKDMNEQRAQWAKEVAEIRAEEEKSAEEHILLCAIVSLLAILCSLKTNSILLAISFPMNMQIYRYFKKYNCRVEKFDLDMKVSAVVVGVSLLLMIVMPVFIVAEVFVNIAKTIYGIATLCAILNAAYICVYLYGMRKKVES